MFMIGNKSLEQIQHLMGPSQSTIDSYIIACINAGYKYQLQNFQIQQADIDKVGKLVNKLIASSDDKENSLRSCNVSSYDIDWPTVKSIRAAVDNTISHRHIKFILLHLQRLHALKQQK